MSEISGAARSARGAPSHIFLIASTQCQPRRENLLGLRDRECLSLLHDLCWYPVWKMFSSRLVGPAASVLVPYFGQLFLLEAGGKLDQCGPQTAMHVGNLAFDQFANQDVGARTNRLYRMKDLFSFRMAPPTAADSATSNRLRQIWQRATGSLENDSVTFNKCERLLLVHHVFRLSPPPT
jgi:hypothetical protein